MLSSVSSSSSKASRSHWISTLSSADSTRRMGTACPRGYVLRLHDEVADHQRGRRQPRMGDIAAESVDAAGRDSQLVHGGLRHGTQATRPGSTSRYPLSPIWMIVLPGVRGWGLTQQALRRGAVLPPTIGWRRPSLSRRARSASRDRSGSTTTPDNSWPGALGVRSPRPGRPGCRPLQLAAG